MFSLVCVPDNTCRSCRNVPTVITDQLQSLPVVCTTPVPVEQLQSINVKPRTVTRKILLSPESPATAWERHGEITVGGEDIDIARWTDQDIAVLGMVFGVCWNRALECEASSRPNKSKPPAMRKLLQDCWKPCKAKLKVGLHTKQNQNR